MDPVILDLIVFPMLIFVFRIIDVSLGTLRIIFTTQGRRKIAPIIGFLEVFIWLVAMKQIFSNADNWLYYIAYAAGFASGNYLGMVIENKLAMGFYLVRIVSKKDEPEMIQEMQNSIYGLTVLDAEGTAGKLKLIFVIVKRKNILKLRHIIENHDRDVFLSIEPIHSIEQGLRPSGLQPRHHIAHFAKKMK